jgi:hypothetical protein
MQLESGKWRLKEEKIKEEFKVQLLISPPRLFEPYHFWANL